MPGGLPTRDPATRLAALLLALVLACVASLVWALLVGDPDARATAHPEHTGMLRAAPGAEQTAPLLLPGYVFGALQLLFFGVCFALGMRRRDSPGLGLGRWLLPTIAGVVLYEACWAALVWSDLLFVRSPLESARVGGLPLPTWLLIFAMWPFPLVFMVIYLRAFDSWLCTEEDLARFRTRTAALRAQSVESDR